MVADPLSWLPTPVPGSPHPQTSLGRAPCPLDEVLVEEEEAWAKTAILPVREGVWVEEKGEVPAPGLAVDAPAG